VVEELFHADGQTYRHDEVSSRFSQFLGTRQEMSELISSTSSRAFQSFTDITALCTYPVRHRLLLEHSVPFNYTAYEVIAVLLKWEHFKLLELSSQQCYKIWPKKEGNFTGLEAKCRIYCTSPPACSKVIRSPLHSESELLLLPWLYSLTEGRSSKWRTVIYAAGRTRSDTSEVNGGALGWGVQVGKVTVDAARCPQRHVSYLRR